MTSESPLLRVATVCLQICGDFCVQAFSVNTQTKELELTKSKLRYLLFICLTILAILDCVYLLSITASALAIYGSHKDGRIKMILIRNVARSSWNIFGVLLCLKQNKIVLYYNILKELEHQLQRENALINVQRSKNSVKYLWIMVSLVVTHAIAAAYDYLKDRHSIVYWPARVLSNGRYHSGIAMLFSTVLRWWLTVYTNGGLIATIVFVYLYIDTISGWMEFLTRETSKERDDEFAHYYSQMEMLNTYYSECFANTLTLGKVAIFFNFSVMFLFL